MVKENGKRVPILVIYITRRLTRTTNTQSQPKVMGDPSGDGTSRRSESGAKGAEGSGRAVQGLLLLPGRQDLLVERKGARLQSTQLLVLQRLQRERFALPQRSQLEVVLRIQAGQRTRSQQQQKRALAVSTTEALSQRACDTTLAAATATARPRVPRLDVDVVL